MLIITALLENFIILTFQPGTPGWYKQNDRMSRILSIPETIPAGKSGYRNFIRVISHAVYDNILFEF